MKSVIFECKSCKRKVSVNRDYIRMIELGANLILENVDIEDSRKIAYISETEVGVNFGRIILPNTEIVSSILNKVLICCPDRNWIESYEQKGMI